MHSYNYCHQFLIVLVHILLLTSTLHLLFFTLLFTAAETLDELLEALDSGRYSIRNFAEMYEYVGGKTDILIKGATNLYLIVDIMEQHGLFMLPP